MDAAILCSFGKFTLEERQLAVNFIERIRDLKETKYQDDKGETNEPYKDYLSNPNNYPNMLDVIFQNAEEYLDEYNEEEDEEEDKNLRTGALFRQPTVEQTPLKTTSTQQKTPATRRAVEKAFASYIDVELSKGELLDDISFLQQFGTGEKLDPKQLGNMSEKQLKLMRVELSKKIGRNSPTLVGKGGRKKRTKRKNRRKKKKRTKRKRRK